ncbi:hypothetical protein ACET3X_009295 [Alternaria dauci]|uniref:Uncharacterized protein n=1 Tax=Alternaria dauci TaxID=48095 RepID=A0ABR3U8E9_9PLEO
MHASSIVALALGVAAVSGTAIPDLQTRDGACDPECNFPNSMTCFDNGGATLQKADIVAAARNADRSGKPYEASASNIASEFCSMRAYRDIPFWTTTIPGPNSLVGSMYYALASNGTFYFCGTTSGIDPSGWPGRCDYN